MRVKRKGWFIVPGQEGDRTLAEQMRGLQTAIAACAGKTVLDLGCAEGLISFEFAKAGAARVHGIDVVTEHLRVASDLRDRHGLANVTFELGHLARLRPMKQYDIVLALGVAHKLPEPGVGIRYAAASSSELVLVRMSARVGKAREEHILRSKRYDGWCNVTDEMAQAGFTLERIEAGPREETVHYYRRAC